jgi:hypothetical protein
LHLKHGLYGAETWTLRKVDKYPQRFFEPGAGEDWRSVGSIMLEIKKCFIESMRKGMSYVQ